MLQTLCNEATLAVAALHNTTATVAVTPKAAVTATSETSNHVTVLLGLPGSSVLSCAATVLKLTSSSVHWQPVLLSFGSSACSFADVVSAISTATVDTATADTRVLLAVSSVHSAIAVATAATHCGLMVDSITACIAADQVHTDSTTDANESNSSALAGTQQWRQGLFEQASYSLTLLCTFCSARSTL
jgi:hypothetical protein